VTASTGVAACLIGGVTLHSFAGVGAGDKSVKAAVEMARRPAAGSSWRRCKTLIIDEISMVDAQFFDVSFINFFLNISVKTFIILVNRKRCSGGTRK
jgi:hypothetical protein